MIVVAQLIMGVLVDQVGVQLGIMELHHQAVQEIHHQYHHHKEIMVDLLFINLVPVVVVEEDLVLLGPLLDLELLILEIMHLLVVLDLHLLFLEHQ